MMFRRQDRERIARGEITLTFRLWKSPQVKAGKRYTIGIGTIEVEDVKVMPAALISPEDVAPSGCASIAAIWALAGEHTGSAAGPETLLHRVRFRYLGDVPASSARAHETDLDRLVQRLTSMDRLSAHGPWTSSVLRLIDEGPNVPARLLAAELGWQTADFKTHVRRLKTLGLTISHDVGYELSDLGRQCLVALAQQHRRAGNV